MAKVELAPQKWTGDHPTLEGEEVVCLLGPRTVLIDGIPVSSNRCDLYLELEELWTVTIDKPTDEMRAIYAPDQYLEGTNEYVLVLPITELVTV